MNVRSRLWLYWLTFAFIAATGITSGSPLAWAECSTAKNPSVTTLGSDKKKTFDIVGGSEAPTCPPSSPGPRNDDQESEDRADDADVIPDFITRFVKARDHGGYNCAGNGCRASRTACSAAPDYVVANGDVVATPRASGPRAPGSVTYESITRETATGADSSNGYTCLTPSDADPGNGGDGGGAAEPVVITMTVTDFASLPVQPLVASAGPEDGWLPVGMVNVLYAEPEVQTLETEILGTPVSVRAIPTDYHWDLGDGNTITTAKPGEPFPSEEISAAYVAEGWYDITLTTTFAGQFSVAGGE